MSAWCKVGEHEVPENIIIEGMNCCLDCYNITQKFSIGGASKLDEYNHDYFISRGYYLDKNKGYVKRRV